MTCTLGVKQLEKTQFSFEVYVYVDDYSKLFVYTSTKKKLHFVGGGQWEYGITFFIMTSPKFLTICI